MRRPTVVPTVQVRAPAPPAVPKTTKLGIHEGHALSRAAGEYPSLREAVLEAVQNSIDAGAKRINVNINQQNRSIFIHDNGVGVSINRFNDAIACVGESQKERGKLGQFGIGIVSAFGKCRVFTFSSRPTDGSNGMMQWTFETDKLKDVESGMTIPIKPRPPSQDQWWNSELAITDYTTDKMRAKIDMDLISDQIIDRYNEHMKTHHTVVRIKLTSPDGEQDEREVRPVSYTGTPIPIKSFIGESAGKTEFQLYVAKTKTVKTKTDGRRTSRAGRVKVVDSSGYGIELTHRVLQGLLSEKYIAKLTDGLFEGEIHFSDKVRIEPSRRVFAQTDALLEACGHIEKWLSTTGQKFIDTVNDEEASERYSRLGQTSLKVVRSLLAERPDLAALVKTFQYGSVGKEHAPTDGRKGGTVGAKSIDGTGKRTGTRCGDSRSSEPKERKDHSPMSVEDKDGQSRTLIRDNSHGLILRHGPIPNNNLWYLDESTGVLTINVMHPSWEECNTVVGRSESARDKIVCDLQERIILHALHLMKIKKDLGVDITGVELYAQEYMSSEVFLITKADQLAMRGQFVDRRGKERKAEQEAKKTDRSGD